MWSVSILHQDPLIFDKENGLQDTKIVTAQCDELQSLFPIHGNSWEAFLQGGRVARVAFADFVARSLGSVKLQKQCSSNNESTTNGHKNNNNNNNSNNFLAWELLGDAHVSSARHGRRQGRFGRKSSSIPFMLERTDIFCSQDVLSVQLRVFVYAPPPPPPPPPQQQQQQSDESENNGIVNAIMDQEQKIQTLTADTLQQHLTLTNPETERAMMNHIATAVLQDCIRKQLSSLKAVAFVANQAILPRKSGASHAPMCSPPAIPFAAPTDSPMNRTLEIRIGRQLKSYLHVPSPMTTTTMTNGHNNNCCPDDTVCISGLLIPQGVSLIVGGGYHGKSTLLRTIAAGVYNKIPGDGREFCVTDMNAVTVRAEDGRYVNNCNVSAFISNLPTPPGVTKTIDTTHFSTGEASGSTSQAANVSEAIEMGCSAFLVDEDVSAANFMARDGRMRALVMDESITPLLYRVNGLYYSHGISSIVVVGGVGDWLDVPHSVILMDKYMCRDATSKAQSVSRQFSHGHVQYAGRGVVHRLPWEKTGTPIPRRPVDSFAAQFPSHKTALTLLEGSNALAVHHTHALDDMHVEEEEDDHFVDMSRCEQLMGSKSQLYGCGLCLLWILEVSQQFPQLGMPDLLKKLDEALDENGLAALVPGHMALPSGDGIIEKLGFAYRPRRFEVGQALTRLRGIKFQEILLEDDGSEAAAAAEADRKKKELMEMWNKRRQKSN